MISERLRSLAKVPAVAREGAVYAIAGTLNRAAGLILLPLYTHRLTEAEVGAYGVLISIVLLFQIVTITGMDSATARWFFHKQDSQERLATFSSWILWQGVASALVAVPAIVLAPLISKLLIGEVSGADDAVRFAAMTLISGIVPNTLFNWFRLHRRPVAAGITATSQALAVALASILAIQVFDLGLPGVFIGQFAAGLMVTLIALVLEGDPMMPFRARQERIREMLKFALPLVPAGAAFWIVGVADRLFLRAFSDMDQVGRYQVVATVAAGVGLFTQAFQLSWGPAALSIQERPNSRRVYSSVLSGYMAGGGIICFLTAAFGSIVVAVVANDQYSGLLAPLVILTGSVVFQGVLAIVSVGPTIAGTSRPTLEAVSAAAVVNTALNLALIPPWGLLGASWATCAGMLTLAAVGLWRSEQVWHVGYRVKELLFVMLVCAVVAAGATYSVEQLGGFPRVGALVVLAGVLVGAFGPLIRSLRAQFSGVIGS